MAKIVKTVKVDEELKRVGFELGQRVYVPAFKQAGTITGMTDLTIEGVSWDFRAPGEYRFIDIRLDDGHDIREAAGRIEKHLPSPSIPEGQGLLVDSMGWE